MDYYALAEELLNMRASMPQVKVERQMSKMARGEILALIYLSANNNRAYPKDLSKNMMVSTARVATLLNHLEKDNLITRIPDAEDSRKIIVELTDGGRVIVEQHRKKMLESVVKLLEKLGSEDAKEYVRLHKKVLQLFSE